MLTKQEAANMIAAAYPALDVEVYESRGHIHLYNLYKLSSDDQATLRDWLRPNGFVFNVNSAVLDLGFSNDNVNLTLPPVKETT